MYQFITKSDCNYYQAYSDYTFNFDTGINDHTIDIQFNNKVDGVWITVDTIIILDTDTPPNLHQIARDWFKSNIPN